MKKEPKKNMEKTDKSGLMKEGEIKKKPKIKLTKKLQKKLDELLGKDPNIYPLW